MKTNFLLTTPKKDVVTPMIIENIWVKSENRPINTEEGEHIIEMKLSELISMDIRVGDTVNFIGEECKGSDLTQRPANAVSFLSPDDLAVKDKRKVRVKSKKK